MNPLNKVKILVVDDSEEIRKLISAYLEQQSFTIIEAENGEEAFQKALTREPDVIILDIMMPKVDGIETVKTLKEDERTMDIPVIMVTALSDTDSVLSSYEYGADFFLTKPIAREDLRKALNFVESHKKRVG